MDAVIVAWRGFFAAHKFLFWALVAWFARWYVEKLHAVYWHREASREMLVLKPRRPKDLYDGGYVLFAYDISSDCWLGYWRVPNAVPGTPAAETYAWREQWSGIPFHEVEFADQPEITFKVRAVQLDWCRQNLKEGEAVEIAKATEPGKKAAVAAADARQMAQALAESDAGATKH